jgi:hypothetical protein
MKVREPPQEHTQLRPFRLRQGCKQFGIDLLSHCEVAPHGVFPVRRQTHNIGTCISGLPLANEVSRPHELPDEGSCAGAVDTRLANDCYLTGAVRRWHRTVAGQVGACTANLAKKFLRAALALAAEDFGLRVPAMPSKLGKGRPKTKKAILTPEQVGAPLKAAVEGCSPSALAGQMS